MVRRSTCSVLLSVACSAPLYAQPALSRADYPSNPGARAVATADFNRDGWPDIAHANAGRDSVTVLLNRGNNSSGFARAFDVPVGHGPFDMATADFNRDTIPDLVIANADSNSLSVLIGDGRGSFTRTDISAPGNPRGITVADMNRDGMVDIVYTAFGINRVQVLTGNGGGGFTTGASVTGIAQRPQGIAAADINRDGQRDLVVAYASPGGRLTVLLMNRSGGTVAQTIPGEDNLNVVTTGDFNRDGWLDAAAVSTGNSRLAVYLGGASGLRQHATYPTGTSPRGLRAADLNGDGLLDLIAANRESHTVSVFTSRRDAPGSFTSTEFAAGRGSRELVAADFDHDGLIDIATGNQDDSAVTVLWNMSQLVRPGLVFTLEPAGVYGGFDPVVVADLDHDGRPDRIAATGNIIFGDGRRGTFPARFGLPKIADVNGDGHLDFVQLESHPDKRVHVIVGDGRGGFTAPSTTGAWSSRTILTDLQLGDVNSDGKQDILVTGYESTIPLQGFLFLFVGNGDGTFQPQVTTSIRPGSWFSVLDLNRDGHLDFVSTPFDNREAFLVRFGDGNGNFPRTDEYVTPDFIAQVAVGDFNHDGWPDLAGATFESIVVKLGAGGGALAPPVRHEIPAYRLTVADLNHDGHLDIVSNGSVTAQFGNGDGTFGEGQGFRPYSYQPVVADINEDGLADIVLGANEMLFNQRNETNTPPVSDAGPDVNISYAETFNEDDEDMILLSGLESNDADEHRLTYEWRNASGTLLGTNAYLAAPQFTPGTYVLTLRVFDGRGGSDDDTMTLTIRPIPEIVLHTLHDRAQEETEWGDAPDPTAAAGYRKFQPDRGAAKVNVPLANPANWFDVWFIADPTQEYKLWIRGKAQNDHWGNDSAWVQFEHSLDRGGAAAYRIGTASALPFNLEECGGCGIAGWGWEDDGWGAVDRLGTTIKFAKGGWQRLRIQTREDGLSIDQIILSAGTYKTTRPGTAKNDTTIVPFPRQQ